MATKITCDLTGKLIPSPAQNAGRRVTLIQHHGVTLRIETVAPCDLHPEAIRTIVRDGVAVAAPREESKVLALPVRPLQLLPGNAS